MLKSRRSFTRLLVSALIAVPLSACASSGGQEPGNSTGTAGAITLRDYTANSSMTLTSHSELERIGIPGETPADRRLAFYSEERTDASAKVCDDDAIAGLVELFQSEGLDRWYVDGPAPAAGGDRDNAFEVTVDGTTRHVMKGAMGEDWPAFVECMKGFVGVYNIYEGRSNVDGSVTFEKPTFGDGMRGNR
ncbi:MAG: hypothetical protein AAF726_15100 [Planctomycetota bacterium]